MRHIRFYLQHIKHRKILTVCTGITQIQGKNTTEILVKQV